ncbi:hypothetical protein E4T49_06764 [Aureobasidium sp. EXF-10728]|nr:hypothetical protein E4T49_06764 [Aureobasidium sp. EXF-10728]
MRFTQTFFAVAALAAVGFADDNGPCDDQNDNGVVCSNGTPVSSNGVAINTNTATNTVTGAGASSTTNPRISVISSTNTDILVSTSSNIVLDTTSFPHSLDTRTSTYLNTVVQTLNSQYTTNTLNTNTMTATSRVGGNAATTTAATNTVTTGTAASSSTGAAAALQPGFAPFEVAMAALGFAAVL